MTRKKWDVQNSVEAGGWGPEHHINNDTGIGPHVPATADLAVRLGRRCPHFAPMTALARLQFVSRALPNCLTTLIAADSIDRGNRPLEIILQVSKHPPERGVWAEECPVESPVALIEKRALAIGVPFGNQKGN